MNQPLNLLRRRQDEPWDLLPSSRRSVTRGSTVNDRTKSGMSLSTAPSLTTFFALPDADSRATFAGVQQDSEIAQSEMWQRAELLYLQQFSHDTIFDRVAVDRLANLYYISLHAATIELDVNATHLIDRIEYWYRAQAEAKHALCCTIL